jgi:hypothetical protein
MGLNFLQFLQTLCHQGFYTNAKNVTMTLKIWVQLRKHILRKTKQELTWRSDATIKKIKKRMEAVSVMLPNNPPNPPNQDQNLLTAKNYEEQAKYEDKVPHIIQVNFRIFWIDFFDFFDVYSSQTAK